MFRWKCDNHRISFHQRIIEFVARLNNLYQDIIIKNFNYIYNLRNSIHSFQTNSTVKFVDINEYKEEDVCQICLMPLLGPCTSFNCMCN